MNTNRHFDHQFTVKAAVERVVGFHQDIKTLKQLTPPPMFVSLNDVGYDGENKIADFNIWIGLIPIRWVAVISEDETNPGFIDKQVKGPFDYWEHRHTFIPIDARETRIVDRITARPSKHPFWGLISWFIWATLPILFSYRKWRTRREIESDKR